MIRQNSYSTDVDVEFCNIKINGKADSFDYFCRSFSKEKVELRLPEHSVSKVEKTVFSWGISYFFG